MYVCIIKRFGPGALHHWQCVINTTPETKLIFGEKSQANRFKERFDVMELALEAGEVSAEEGVDWLLTEKKLCQFLYRKYASDIEKLNLVQSIPKPILRMLPAEKAESLMLRTHRQTQERMQKHFIDESFREQLEGI